MNSIELPGKGFLLSNDQRINLRSTLGEVVSGELPMKYTDNRPIITVGDVVTEVLYGQGVVPDLGVIDNKTRRGDYSTESDYHTKKIKVKNPPGMITTEAWKAIEYALEEIEPMLIIVDGEEDLLSIVSIILCPEGGIVIYGIPCKGMVVNLVDHEKKEKCWEVINKMRKVE